MNYFDKFIKQKKGGGNYAVKWLPAVYITVEGEILDKSFKDNYNYKFLKTITEVKEHGIKQNIKFVELGERKNKQLCLFD